MMGWYSQETLDCWQDAAYDLACQKGWWDTPRMEDVTYAMILSELFEALEQYRMGQRIDHVYIEIGDHTNKPEGIAVELADFVIRILDASAAWRVSLEAACESDTLPAANLPSLILDLSDLILTDRTPLFDPPAPDSLSIAIGTVYRFLRDHGVDLWETVELKHAYNKTRPYRHGGKRI